MDRDEYDKVIPLGREEFFLSLSTKLELNLNFLCMEQNHVSTCSRAPTNIKTKKWVHIRL